MVAVAELGAGLISARTKTALAPAKRRGVKLGGNRGVTALPVTVQGEPVASVQA